MAEIRPDQYQNGDMSKDVEIKRDVKLYITKSYMMAVFLCNSMFNTIIPFTLIFIGHPSCLKLSMFSVCGFLKIP